MNPQVRSSFTFLTVLAKASPILLPSFALRAQDFAVRLGPRRRVNLWLGG
jgi:hypothetical protein